jgi:type VI secretion system protein ImpM
MQSNPIANGTVSAAGAGWFGKLPMLGDFASRRLPEGFVARWDEWLMAGIEASKVELGDRWLDVYLNAPIWRFWLAAGAIDENAWMGIIMSSVDRVGRYFPFTAAIPIDPPDRALPIAAASTHWYRGLEDIAFRSMAGDSTIEQLEAELAQLGQPTDPRSPSTDLERRFNVWWESHDAAPLDLPAIPGADPGGIVAAAWDAAAAARGGAFTAWWHEPDAGFGRLRCFRSLPAANHFALLLAG